MEFLAIFSYFSLCLSDARVAIFEVTHFLFTQAYASYLPCDPSIRSNQDIWANYAGYDLCSRGYSENLLVF